MDVKQRIREIIAARDDLSVRGVSLKAGMSDSALHKFLTTDASMSIANLERVAEAMGVTVVSLLGEPEPAVATANVVRLWSRIAARDQSQALAILETFADKAVGDGEGRG